MPYFLSEQALNWKVRAVDSALRPEADLAPFPLLPLSSPFASSRT